MYACEDKGVGFELLSLYLLCLCAVNEVAPDDIRRDGMGRSCRCLEEVKYGTSINSNKNIPAPATLVKTSLIAQGLHANNLDKYIFSTPDIQILMHE